jgi:arylsulfatase A-like enzyme
VAARSEFQGLRDTLSQAAGEIISGAVVAALLWAALQAARVSDATGAGWLRSMMTATALALVPMLLGVAAMRWVSRSLAQLQPEPARRSLLTSALWLWAAGSAVGLTVFGMLLHTGTHHRGLGGATFGLVGAVAVLACGVLAWRAAMLLAGALQRRPVALAIAICSGVLILVVTRAAIRAPAGAELAPASAASWDSLAALLAAALGSAVRIRFPYSRLVTPASSGVFVLLVTSGMTVAPAVARAQGPAAQQAPLVGVLLKLVVKKPAPETPAPTSSNVSPSAAQPAAPHRPPREPLAVQAPKAEDKPDIILISLDTVRADHLGIYGSKRPTSARLDALAEQAAVFERAYATGPETRTAVAPLVTGRLLEHSERDERPWPTLLDPQDTVAELLQVAGYATGAVSSFQWLSRERGFAQGFDVFDESPFRKVHPERWSTSAHAVAQAIAAHEELLKRRRPIFLWVHLFDAHHKYLAHPEFGFGDSDADRYDAELAYQDQQLGKLIERVQSGPRGANTVWIVHGTHGEAFGEHGLQGHPVAGFDEIVRVPLVVRLPQGSSRRVTDAVSTLDIAPTILELAGAKAAGLAGHSLREAAEGAPPSEQALPGVAVSYAGVPGSREREQLRVWVAPPWKLVVQGAKAAEKISLYDFATDPGEMQDLADSKPDEVASLRQQLDAWLVAAARRERE